MSRRLPVLTQSPLPPLYAAWLDQLLAGPIPRETDATCDDCAMCPDDGDQRNTSETFFNPETKCCTYIPTLPNYLVGRILADDDPNFAAGRATVAERMRAGIAVTPLGLRMPPVYGLLYVQTSGQTFGTSKTLLCPHYLADEGGRCGIWKHRASVCATWYCKFVRGAVGAKFWQALHQLLSAVEQSLSRWCVNELGIEVEALRLLFPPRIYVRQDYQVDGPTLDGKVDRGAYERVWGKWLGREAEFYREAGRLVSGLSWQKVVSLSGAEIKIFEKLVRDAYAGLVSKKLPLSLTVGRLNVLNLGRQSVRVTAYRPMDPLDLPSALFAALPYFDGRPTKAALKEIEERLGIRLSPALVRKLSDFEILITGEIPIPRDLDG